MLKNPYTQHEVLVFSSFSKKKSDAKIYKISYIPKFFICTRICRIRKIKNS